MRFFPLIYGNASAPFQFLASVFQVAVSSGTPPRFADLSLFPPAGRSTIALAENATATAEDMGDFLSGLALGY